MSNGRPAPLRSLRARPSAARIRPFALEEIDRDLVDVPAKAIYADGKVANVFGTQARHPELLRRFNALGIFLLREGLLPERERELVILRVGANAQAVYEFGQHTLSGRRAGLRDDEIAALTEASDAHPWSEADLDLIALADELADDDCVSDDTWARLAARWSDEEMMELVVLAGYYLMISGFLNSAGVELDPGIPSWP